MSSEANGTLEQIPKMLNNIEESNTQLNSLIDSLTEKIKSGQLDMNEVSTQPPGLLKCTLTDYWLFHVWVAPMSLGCSYTLTHNLFVTSN